LTLSSCANVSRLGLLALVVGITAAGAATAKSAPSSGCTAGTTQALVRSFVAGYNAGRVAAIDRMWAREPSFQWYSTIAPGSRLGSKAYDRTTLAAYFRRRARMHERITLIELRAGYDQKRNLVNFAGKLVRHADDGGTAGPKDFKGAAACPARGPSLIVWSM
jgi:hypothetical protein